MSTMIWPEGVSTEVNRAMENARRGEMEWLLASLQDTLASLKKGLEECAALLAPHQMGATLVLSSQRSEYLKGFITRVGTRVVKGDIHLRVPSLPVPRGQTSYRISVDTQSSATPIVLEQLVTARSVIDSCLDVVDATRWTGDSHNADFISGQLTLLHDNIQAATAALRGRDDSQRPWYEDSIDADAFRPPLPSNLSLHLSISEAAVLLNVRVLEPRQPVTSVTPTFGLATGPGAPSYSGLSLRERLTTALGGPRPAHHDELHDVFHFRGQDVRVRDKVRVESQDPSLMSAMAKLAALGHSVALSRRALSVIMGAEED